jgi:hypothetical protein
MYLDPDRSSAFLLFEGFDEIIAVRILNKTGIEVLKVQFSRLNENGKIPHNISGFLDCL